MERIDGADRFIWHDWFESLLVGMPIKNIYKHQAPAPHEQSSHGNWATGGSHGGSQESIGDVTPAKEFLATASDERIQNILNDTKQLLSSIGMDRIGNKKSVQRALVDELSQNKDFMDYVKTRYIVEGTPGQTDSYYVSEVIRQMVDCWAGTAADDNPVALAMQRAVEVEFGLKDAYMPYRGTELEKWSPGRMVNEAAMKEFQKNGGAYRAFARAQYNATQQYLQDLEVEELVLYRGVGRSGLGWLPGSENKGMKDITVKMMPVSSFSMDISTASLFADFKDMGAILTVAVPRERILSTPRTGVGCTPEAEITVLGGTQTVTSLSVNGITYRHAIKDEVRRPYPQSPQSTDTPIDIIYDNAVIAMNAIKRPPDVKAQKPGKEEVALIDQDPEDQDWTKMTWDLPPYGSPEFLEQLKFMGMTLEQFQKLPAYRLTLGKEQKMGLSRILKHQAPAPHEQSSHGNWASGREAAPIEDKAMHQEMKREYDQFVADEKLTKRSNAILTSLVGDPDHWRSIEYIACLDKMRRGEEFTRQDFYRLLKENYTNQFDFDLEESALESEIAEIPDQWYEPTKKMVAFQLEQNKKYNPKIFPKEVKVYKGQSAFHTDNVDPGLGFWTTSKEFAELFAGSKGSVYEATVDRDKILYSSHTSPKVYEDYRSGEIGNMLGSIGFYSRADEMIIDSADAKNVTNIGHGSGQMTGDMGYRSTGWTIRKENKLDLQKFLAKFRDWFFVPSDTDAKPEKKHQAGPGHEQSSHGNWATGHNPGEIHDAVNFAAEIMTPKPDGFASYDPEGYEVIKDGQEMHSYIWDSDKTGEMEIAIDNKMTSQDKLYRVLKDDEYFQQYVIDIINQDPGFVEYQRSLIMNNRQALQEWDLMDPQEKANKAVLREMVNYWAQSSGDTKTESLAIQMAVEEEFGLKGTVIPHRDYGRDEGFGSDMTLPKVKSFYRENKEALHAFVRAQYDITQASLKEKGIDNLLLYRGTDQFTRDSFPGFETYQKSGYANYPVKMQPISSFTLDPGTALAFGDHVLVGVVPRERVFACPKTGIGCTSEEEVVILGGTDNVTVVRAGSESGKHLIMDNILFYFHQQQKKKSSAKSAKPPVNIDGELQAADWTKKSWDLPEYGSPAFALFLQRQGMTLEEFQKLPAYYLVYGENKKNIYKHLPGQHDQSSHGRRGGAGTLHSAGDKEEVREEEIDPVIGVEKGKVSEAREKIKAWITASGKQGKVESAALVTREGNVVYVKGKKDSVTFPSGVLDNAVFLTHNHPFGDDDVMSAGFSAQDLAVFMARRNIKMMEAIGHDGRVFRVQKTEDTRLPFYAENEGIQDKTMEVVGRWYDVQEKLRSTKYKNKKFANRVERTKAWFDLVEEVNQTLAKEYHFNINTSTDTIPLSKTSSLPVMKQEDQEEGDFILDDSDVNHYPEDWGEIEESEGKIIRQSDEKGVPYNGKSHTHR